MFLNLALLLYTVVHQLGFRAPVGSDGRTLSECVMNGGCCRKFTLIHFHFSRIGDGFQSSYHGFNVSFAVHDIS